MNMKDSSQPQSFTGGIDIPSTFQSPLLGMATPLQRERSHSEKVTGRSFAPSSLDTGTNYYARVFETNDPETIKIVEPSMNPPHSGRLYPSVQKTVSNAPETEPLINQNIVRANTKQRTILLFVISLLVLLVLSAIVSYFICLDTPQVQLVSFTRADLRSTKGNILDTVFSMELHNPNVQSLHIKTIDVTVCFRARELANESLCIGLLHDHESFSISGQARTDFDVAGRFNISSLATKYRIINTLRKGDFDTDMTGTLHYSTFGFLDMKHHIDTSTYVRNPLLD